MARRFLVPRPSKRHTIKESAFVATLHLPCAILLLQLSFLPFHALPREETCRCFIKPKRRQRLAYEGHDRDSTLVDFAKAVSDITVLYRQLQSSDGSSRRVHHTEDPDSLMAPGGILLAGSLHWMSPLKEHSQSPSSDAVFASIFECKFSHWIHAARQKPSDWHRTVYSQRLTAQLL